MKFHVIYILNIYRNERTVVNYQSCYHICWKCFVGINYIEHHSFTYEKPTLNVGYSFQINKIQLTDGKEP